MDAETELTLVRKLREGDAAAFDAVHAEYNAPLFGFLAEPWRYASSRPRRCASV
jgi:hypothetical protein